MDATDRKKKDTHGCLFVASSSASQSRLQKDRGVHKWNLTQQFITLSQCFFFFYLYLCVRCDVRLTICLVCIKPCSLVGMYRLFREVCYFCYKPRNEFDDCPTRCDLLSLLHLCRQLYMFRVLTPNIRISYSCNYSFWY